MGLVLPLSGSIKVLCPALEACVGFESIALPQSTAWNDSDPRVYVSLSCHPSSTAWPSECSQDTFIPDFQLLALRHLMRWNFLEASLLNAVITKANVMTPLKHRTGFLHPFPTSRTSALPAVGCDSRYFPAFLARPHHRRVRPEA